MNLDVMTELWTILIAMTPKQQIMVSAAAMSILGIGFVIGRWSTAHHNSTLKTEKTILENKLDSAENDLADFKQEYDSLEINIVKPSVHDLRFEDGMYYEPGIVKITSIGHEKNIGPFCPRCWEIDGVRVSVHKKAFDWECINRHGCGFTRQHTKLPSIRK